MTAPKNKVSGCRQARAGTTYGVVTHVRSLDMSGTQEFYSYQNSGPVYLESNGAESVVTQAKIVTLMDSTEVKGRETNAAGHWQHTDATRELKGHKCELHQ